MTRVANNSKNFNLNPNTSLCKILLLLVYLCTIVRMIVRAFPEMSLLIRFCEARQGITRAGVDV